MDLSMLDTTMKAEEGVEMNLLHPVDNSDTGVVLVLKGSSSKSVKAALAKYRKITEDERKSEADKDKAASDFLSKCIIDIKNATYKGEPLEDGEAGIKFFIETFSWAASPVIEFIHEIENFLPGSDNS